MQKSSNSDREIKLWGSLCAPLEFEENPRISSLVELKLPVFMGIKSFPPPPLRKLHENEEKNCCFVEN